MMYIHRNNEIDKRINVSKRASISTTGDNSTAAGLRSSRLTVSAHSRSLWDEKERARVEV